MDKKFKSLLREAHENVYRIGSRTNIPEPLVNLDNDQLDAHLLYFTIRLL